MRIPAYAVRGRVDPQSPGWRTLAICVIAMLAGCSKGPEAPVLHSIEGHVKLTGFLTQASGHFAGTRVVGDADGVEVELAYGSRIVGRVRTVDGVWKFAGLGPGAYVARTRVVGGIADTTEELTVVGRDVAARDTLKLVARGDLYPAPNPSPDSTLVFFEVPRTETVAIRVLDLGGHLVRTLYADLMLPGVNETMWDGRDADGLPVADAMYWITFESGEDIRAQLLFRGPAPAAFGSRAARSAVAGYRAYRRSLAH